MTVVREFHAKFGQDCPSAIPCPPAGDTVRLRMRLIREEYEEVMAELALLTKQMDADAVYGTMARLLKELADLRYVLEGTAVAFALDIDGAFAETHRSNMSKLGVDGKPVYREDGKVLKGPWYTPADMSQFVYLHEGDSA